MKKEMVKGQKNRIMHLDADEIAEPINFIDYFFETSSLPEYLKVLKIWRNEVAFEAENIKKRSPSNILYDYELTIKLIEAAWLLRKQNLGNLKISKNDREVGQLYITRERERTGQYPLSLRFNELLKPSRVLSKIFRTLKLSDYQKILHIWLYDAMSDELFEENLTKYEVIKVYENLVKLSEVLWLVNERIQMRTESLRHNVK